MNNNLDFIESIKFILKENNFKDIKFFVFYNKSTKELFPLIINSQEQDAWEELYSVLVNNRNLMPVFYSKSSKVHPGLFNLNSFISEKIDKIVINNTVENYYGDYILNRIDFINQITKEFNLSDKQKNRINNAIDSISESIEDFIGNTYYDIKKEIPVESVNFRTLLEDTMVEELISHPEVHTAMLVNIDNNKKEILKIIDSKIKKNKLKTEAKL
jgi:hypothetical protein